jgi:hypothetical protein
MDVEDDVRLRQVEEVRVTGDVARMVAKALAAVGVLAPDLALKEHAPGAVQDDDPLLQEPSQSGLVGACHRRRA